MVSVAQPSQYLCGIDEDANLLAHSFNCLLPAHQCTQFAECNDYTGKCNCPAGFGGDDCLEPRK